MFTHTKIKKHAIKHKKYLPRVHAMQFYSGCSLYKGAVENYTEKIKTTVLQTLYKGRKSLN